MGKGKSPGYEVADWRVGYHYGFSDSSNPCALRSTTEAGSQDPIRERLNNNNNRLSRLWHLRIRWGLGQENPPHYNFANTKECLQSIFSIDKKDHKEEFSLVKLYFIVTKFLIRIYSAILLITLEVWYPHGTIFLKLCLKGTLHSGFQLSFLDFALGCPENTGTCQIQYTLSMYLLPFNLSRGPSISFSRDQEINFCLLIYFRAGQ